MQIHYPFHPRRGQTVAVFGRKRHGGEERFIVRQPDGTLMLLPAWMAAPDTDAFRLTSDPRFPVDRLSDLRILIDLLLASASRESTRARGGDHDGNATLPERSVRDDGTTKEHSEPCVSTPEQTAERGLSVKELMEYLMVRRQSLTAILDRLEAAELVDRTRTEGDGRLRHVRLTERGIKTWADMRPSIRGFYDAALAEFSMEESYLLMRLLDRLTAGLAKL